MSAPYDIRIARRAAKTRTTIQRRDQQSIRAAIELLADDPRPPACRTLSGEDGVYRVRVGDYRILHEAVDEVLVIHGVRIGHRREAYR